MLNVVLALRYPPSHRLTNREATVYLAFDVLQLAALLYLTGGITNPFALMFVAPVVIAAATLNLGNTLILAGIAFASVSRDRDRAPAAALAGRTRRSMLPQLYQAGIWASLVIGIGFTSVYAWRIASEGARMSAGLAATQLALSREHRLAALGALATAAAHELGTPLGTIAVVARELERALPENSAGSRRMCACCAHRPNAAAPSSRASPIRKRRMLGATARLPLGALLDDIAAPYRGEDVEIDVIAMRRRRAAAAGLARAGTAARPGQHHRECRRFRRARACASQARWNADSLRIVVEDDGPGFAPEIFERIGEPYITSRPGHHALGETEMGPQAPLGRA